MIYFLGLHTHFDIKKIRKTTIKKYFESWNMTQHIFQNL